MFRHHHGVFPLAARPFSSRPYYTKKYYLFHALPFLYSSDRIFHRHHLTRHSAQTHLMVMPNYISLLPGPLASSLVYQKAV